ncbi:cGMP-dependent protein kinase 1 [Fistulifera solaris]|uniref:cGMP-dependent protein kinase n=1 Tax=Fistulifera solaris TaxID=1519565 RepID=A0A1Z5JKP7_FISSO|nr:cGMP-dependent protein kinase 1 [Fistulifera solaris]|eukprot:GAX14590.1 cGMP-dependent protein kinase 1 [Fistulifera solaris]
MMRGFGGFLKHKKKKAEENKDEKKEKATNSVSKSVKASSKMQVDTPPPAEVAKEPSETEEVEDKTKEVKREENVNIHNKAKRAQNIFSKAIDLNEDFQLPRYPKSDAAVQFIDSALEDNFIFASLSEKERRLLIDAMMMESVPAGTVIIKQGETGDFFYVIEEGHVSFAVDGTHVGSAGRGGSFGELALLYNCPRAATCLANTACRLWKVDQKTFRFMLANNTNSQKKDVHDVLRKVPFLADVDENDLTKISDALTSVTFPEGERIINKGDVGEIFYIIREGTVKVHDIGFGDSKYVDQPLGPGDFFGERALITGDPRVANITATSNCTCLCLSRDTFELVLGPLQGMIDAAMKKRTLLGVPIFSNSQFQPHELARLTDLIVETTFAAGTILAEEGKPFVQNLYIIRSGAVSVAHSDGIINNLKDADYFGDKHLKDEPGTPSKQTITVQKETKCGVLSRRDIEAVIGNIRRLGRPLIAAPQLDKTIKFKDLVKFRILGVGTFGKVWLVSHKRTSKPYALKQLSKREIIGHHQVDGVIREKNIMASLRHPFVVNLVSTFQDDHALYMLIELVQGGELFSIIHTETRDGIPNGNSRFYAACILESLAHLHQRSICYRDLKPENILIDQRGYCVLVDLGFAKIVVDKTYTLCGTPEYLAPEIILSKGHDKGVDYWAYGVLIYEMLVGRSPFYSYGADQVSLFKRIVQVKYNFPPGLVHELAQDLIQRLIVRRQTNRLGCLARGDMDIREHMWFNIIDVDKLLRRQIPPPWKPRIRDPLDATHFDSYRHLENEAPPSRSNLTSEQQAMFKDF